MEKSMIAIVEAYKAGLLSLSNLKTNIIAGIIVGIIALPLAMAFAIASGATPQQGIVTAIVAGIISAIFGGSRTQVCGPTGAFVVILASITAKYGINGLQIATIMAGVMLFLMAIFRLGRVIQFIPHTVIVGFTSGIGLIIFVGQVKDFFGLPIALPIDAPFYHKFVTLLKAFPELNFHTTMLALVSLLIIILSPKFIKAVPSPLIAMVFATTVQYFFDFNDIATIGSVFGGIPQALPSFAWPALNHLHLIDLLEPAFAIALLGAIESLLSATAADNFAKTKHNSNYELFGQGLANFCTPFFGGFASTGAIARTITNIRQGGNCPIAAIVHSLVLVMVVLIFAPLADYVPFAVLAAILFVVSYNMSDLPEVLGIIKKTNWQDISVLFLTFLCTVFLDLVSGVIIGVIAAILFARINQTLKLQS
jgi:SulP family sulfate permease